MENNAIFAQFAVNSKVSLFSPNYEKYIFHNVLNQKKKFFCQKFNIFFS